MTNNRFEIFSLVLIAVIATASGCGSDPSTPVTGPNGLDTTMSADATTTADAVDDAARIDGVGADGKKSTDTDGGAVGTPDAGMPDAGVDDGTADIEADTGATDTTTDAGLADASTADTASADAAGADATPTDGAATDAGTADSGGADSGGADSGGADSGGADSGGVDTAAPGCAKDADCDSRDDGNRCNGVWFCDAGTCKAKPLSVIACKTDQDTACKKSVCAIKTGVCSLEAVSDGASCSDGNACTLTDTCKAGTCAAGSAAVCDDKNPCTANVCDKLIGCKTKEIADGSSCGDSKICATSKCVSQLAVGKCGVNGHKACRTMMAGFASTCAIFGGAVRCWGVNQLGQIGTGGVSIQTPQPGSAVIGLSKVAALAGGSTFGCALKTDGTVACWGGNVVGSLGNGKIAKDYAKDAAYEAKAIVVPGIKSVVDITATSSGTVCVLFAKGTVSCWGDGSAGTLANGKIGVNELSASPVPLKGLTGVRSIAAGSGHVCAMMADATLRCWGYNAFGQLGNGKNYLDYPTVDLSGESTAVVVPGLSNVAAVWAGGRNTCVKINGGEIRCWGSNYYGQVSNGKTFSDYTTVSDELSPQKTLGIAGALQIDGYLFHRCAVLPKGVLKCWGTAYHGALGNGQSGKDVPVVAPVVVSLPAAAIEVTTGGYSDDSIGSGSHTCARLQGGDIYCWGSNFWGQLGNGSTTDSAKPLKIEVASCKDKKDCGDGNSCTIDTCAGGYCSHAVAAGGCNDGNACSLKDTCSEGYCFGGSAANCDDKDPCTVDSCDPKTAQCAHVAAADGTHCGGGLVCSKSACVSALAKGQCGRDGSESCATAAAGAAHTCGISSGVNSGVVRCWGLNVTGQLGRGDTTMATSPGKQVVGLIDAAQIVAGRTHACALRKTGQVNCWGSNTFGQLGNGKSSADYAKDVDFEKEPIAVDGLLDAVDLATTRFSTCAVRATGGVVCWGINAYGQLGNGTAGAATGKSTPTPVPGLTGVVAIDGGANHMCARTDTGSVYCWGWAAWGQLGNSKLESDYAKSSVAFETKPLKVAGVSNVDRLWVDGSTSCVRSKTGKVSCWGRNDWGQLGNGKAGQDYKNGAIAGQPDPAVIAGLSGAEQIVGGTQHRCMRTAKGIVGCWGRTTQGALGLGISGKNTYVAAPLVVNLVGSAFTLTAGGFVGDKQAYAHTCVQLINGQAWCWGSNSFGQLGIGSTKDAASPVKIK